jgi:nucleotide-binding universal stress UspA family protein
VSTEVPAEPGHSIVAGYSGPPTGLDVLAFSTRWARSSGDHVVVVSVHPGSAPVGVGRVDAEWVAYLRDESSRQLAEAKSALPPEVEATYRRVAADSAAHGLHDVAEEESSGGALVVLGSRKTRGLRRTYPGSTAERLLQGAPVSVALVPWGYGESTGERLSRVTVAYVDTPDGQVALKHGASVAQRLGASLEVLSVVPDTRVVPALGDVARFGEEQRAGYEEALEAAVESLPKELGATGRLLDGPVVDALADITPDQADLLICGSRGYGPARRVLLGGVSSRVLRHARVPVLVVPRG